MVDFTVNYQDAGFLDFNDEKHVDKFLEYLFRTDKSQRWTNSMTASDLFIYVQGGKFKMFKFSDNLGDRKEMAELSRLLLQAHGLDCDDVTRGLAYFDLVDAKGMALDVANLKNHSFIIDLINEYNQFEFQFGVVHLDQDSPHLHMVLKKIDFSSVLLI